MCCTRGGCKVRLDRFLVEEGLFASRSKAKEAIDKGRVKVDGKLAKASFSVVGTEKIEIAKEEFEYVSRGGFKLAHGLDLFGLDVTGARALDIGASTGGFTDCLLKRGAKEVVSVDVGKNQLADCLREDNRVISLEETNIKYLDPESVGQFDIITIDVSFISLEKFFCRLPLFMKPHAQVVALIKPQFEAGPNRVGKKGVIKDSSVHLEVLQKIIIDANDAGLYTKNITYSPILGGSGNLEFLGQFNLDSVEKLEKMSPKKLEEIIKEAHKQVINT